MPYGLILVAEDLIPSRPMETHGPLRPLLLKPPPVSTFLSSPSAPISLQNGSPATLPGPFLSPQHHYLHNSASLTCWLSVRPPPALSDHFFFHLIYISTAVLVLCPGSRNVSPPLSLRTSPPFEEAFPLFFSFTFVLPSSLSLHERLIANNPLDS